MVELELLCRPDQPSDRVASMTYWMNRLQNLDPALPLFVSLNPLEEPDPGLVHGVYEYSHPQFNAAAVDAQRHLPAIQGHNRTWYAGAYSGYGFHEDGLQSGSTWPPPSRALLRGNATLCR